MSFLKEFYFTKLDIIKKSNISDIDKKNQTDKLNNLVSEYKEVGVNSEKDFSEYFYLKSLFGSSAKSLFKKDVNLYKYAYPEGMGLEPQKKRDINKWIESLKNLYVLTHQGKTRNEAEKIVTKD